MEVKNSVQLNFEDIKKEIVNFVGKSAYQDSKKVDAIRFVGRGLSGDSIYCEFLVQDDKYWYQRFQVVAILQNHHLLRARCNCSYEGTMGKCKHVAAALLRFQEDIFRMDENEIIRKCSLDVLEEFRKEATMNRRTIKEELGLDVVFVWEGDRFGFYLKIGNQQKYVLKQKLSRFLSVYQENKGKVEFGKKLVYEPKKYYFNEQNTAILNFVYSYFEMHRYYEDVIKLNDAQMRQFLELLKEKEFIVENVGTIDSILNEFPWVPVVKKSDDETYILDLPIEVEQFYPFTDDCEYVLYQKNAYHLNKQNANFICKMFNNGISKLIFDKKDLSKFTNYVIPTIRDNIVIDEGIDDIVVVKRPTAKLYFDIASNSIVCNLKFLYQDKEIDYFKNSRSIVRDIDYENEVVMDLIGQHFLVEDKKIILDGIDNIGYFMEEGLPRLLEKYDVYTSKKLDAMNFISKINIHSMFSIGADNIMNFTFEMDGISNKEIDAVLKNVKEKKKYFKLKNGDIVKLDQDDEIEQFGEMIDNLELNQGDIANGVVEIPKYRAIYLDSLHKRYDFVETNNLFDEFISKFNQYKDVSLSLNSRDKTILRDYQIIGVKWLYNIYKCGFGGILADEMGLGKSIQLIYFIKSLLKEDNHARFLIVVPTSLVYNWENEFKKFAPKLKYHIFAGARQSRHEELKTVDCKIYITSYGLLREDYEEYYRDKEFNVCIIDEAQSIKNPTTEISKTVKKIKADAKFALTGTPLENSVIELWSIFDYIMPGFLSGLKSFQSKYKVKEFDEVTNQKLVGLSHLISPFILRRRKSEVLKDLPSKIENNIYIDLSDEQKKLYAAEVKRVNEEMERLIATEGFDKARFMILQLLTKLRQLCISPSLIYDNYKNSSAKIDNLVKVVRESIDNGHKILIFTSFKKALDLVSQKLMEEGIRVYTIDGSVHSKKRMDLVNKFNEGDDVYVFIITLKSGGTGLNLTSADIVIHLDLWWNPQVENQATDRAHRIGQKNVVEVVKLISKGTIEEKILELQQKKKTLSDKLIEGDMRDTNLISSLTEKDIKKLLSYENANE